MSLDHGYCQLRRARGCRAVGASCARAARVGGSHRRGIGSHLNTHALFKTFSPRLTTPTRRARGPARPGMAAGAPRPGPRPTGRDGVAETAERRVRIRITREPRKSESSERGAGQPVRAVRCTARRAGTEVGAGHRPAESETRATPRATSCRTAGRAPPLLRWPAVPRPLDPRACPGSPLRKHDVYFLYPTRGAPRDLARSCGPPPESHRPPPRFPPSSPFPMALSRLHPSPTQCPLSLDLGLNLGRLRGSRCPRRLRLLLCRGLNCRSRLRGRRRQPPLRYARSEGGVSRRHLD